MDNQDPILSADQRQGHPSRLHPVDWAVRAGTVDQVLAEMNLRIRRHRQRAAALGVFAALAMLGGGFLWRTALVPDVQEFTNRTAILSMPQRRSLSDGSVVDLKAGAEIVVEFTDAVRRVKLVRGEAHFQVAKNKARPFLVEADAVRVRAVGTAFSVALQPLAVEVLVTEGKVAVNDPDVTALSSSRPSSTEKPAGSVLAAGNEVTVDRTSGAIASVSAAVPVSPAEMAQRLAWRVPRLEFSGTPLIEVLPLLNAYGSTHLVLGDPTLGRVRLSGILRADNIDTLLQVLSEEHGIDAVRRDEYTIVLQRHR